MNKITINDKIIKKIDVEDPLEIDTINIENDVEEISDGALEGFFNLRNVIISSNNNLKRIGKSAFKNCFGLVNINLSSCTKLEIIDDEAFSKCSGLRNIRLSNSVRRIGKEAFFESGIVECRLSSSLEEIDERAFSNNKSLAFIIIPNQTRVSDNAFFGDNTEIIQIQNYNNIDKNNIESNSELDTIENKENVIIINQEGKVLSVPIRDKSFYIYSHENGIEYLAAKYLNTFIENEGINWLLSSSFATIFMVDTYSEIFDILGFPNNLSKEQIETIKTILGTHKENIVYGVLEIIDGHVERSADETELTAGTFIDNFETIITNSCRINYFNNSKASPKGPKK